MNVTTPLITHLRKNEAISFAEFMHLALYSPEYGYYTSAHPKFGALGDFITAPELSPLFSQTLGEQCREILKHLGSGIILEFGAGSGKLCVELLKQLARKETLPETYYILEVSGHLRERQKQLVQQEIPELASRVEWISEWPKAFSGIILANEVLDAMPVHRFLQTDDGICESYIVLDEQEQLKEIFKPCTNSRLLAYLGEVLPKEFSPYLSEVNLYVEGWIKQCAASLEQGVMLLIDYGFPRSEFYHPDRNQGTLMCHYQHQAHTNPLVYIGQQDITAHVDFTQIAEAAITAGLDVSGYTNQAAFLLGNGLLSLLEAIQDEGQRLRAAQAVKQLIQPGEMGELFKVIALSKHYDGDLAGFQLQDKRASL
ncbi:class I SAM-dependent methyltransferase [Legionella quinlivanii]|uniref:class I SAM-dependent methyltransferase n=1 Tax=Legionella quinlivanii TaxID=45073 RepID=UPI002244D4DB|nr:SAM-dependent methyltransferase [Legionella quinlivanii]MCW8452370.1 SAM-dependent methyltransferase [Legionella quinlivanii]